MEEVLVARIAVRPDMRQQRFEDRPLDILLFRGGFDHDIARRHRLVASRFVDAGEGGDFLLRRHGALADLAVQVLRDPLQRAFSTIPGLAS